MFSLCFRLLILSRKHSAFTPLRQNYALRLAVDGAMRQEALGWESAGITLEKARVELAKLKEAKRTGVGPCSLITTGPVRVRLIDRISLKITKAMRRIFSSF